MSEVCTCGGKVMYSAMCKPCLLRAESKFAKKVEEYEEKLEEYENELNTCRTYLYGEDGSEEVTA